MGAWTLGRGPETQMRVTGPGRSGPLESDAKRLVAPCCVVLHLPQQGALASESCNVSVARSHCLLRLLHGAVGARRRRVRGGGGGARASRPRPSRARRMRRAQSEAARALWGRGGAGGWGAMEAPTPLHGQCSAVEAPLHCTTTRACVAMRGACRVRGGTRPGPPGRVHRAHTGRCACAAMCRIEAPLRLYTLRTAAMRRWRRRYPARRL